MDIKNFFSGMFGGGSQNILHTPNGDFNLAKSSDRKRIKKMVIELQRTTDALTRRDIADWRNAWQMAINVDSPNRLEKPLNFDPFGHARFAHLFVLYD
mgnify:CR=1 FL=1